jgi:hypothetical protein
MAMCFLLVSLMGAQVRTLNPATHAYSFWEGVPPSGKGAFGRLFAASATLRAVAIVQRAQRSGTPSDMMAGLGFGRLELVASFPVAMAGAALALETQQSVLVDLVNVLGAAQRVGPQQVGFFLGAFIPRPHLSLTASR